MMTPDAQEQRFEPVRPFIAECTWTVLVVDDEDTVRRVVCRMLTSRGVRVLEASTPAVACGLFEQHAQIDLLVTDIRMPLMTGPELARRLVDQRPDLPVLFISGYAPPGDVDLENPRVRLLRKPFPASRLFANISDLLGSR
jgi:two-component system, cell cycle sensor histidine kinase and response regulator CckA